MRALAGFKLARHRASSPRPSARLAQQFGTSRNPGAPPRREVCPFDHRRAAPAKYQEAIGAPCSNDTDARGLAGIAHASRLPAVIPHAGSAGGFGEPLLAATASDRSARGKPGAEGRHLVGGRSANEAEDLYW